MIAHLQILDWIIIVGYILFAIGLGLYHSRKATSSVKQYFASGQGAPWWILGTSIVATTFATDSPLAVSSLVIRRGVAGNWFGWNHAFMQVFIVFFFARLWRRANILTDAEFAELRYSGNPAAILRCFRGLYFGIVYNCIIIGWVNLAMAKIIMIVLNLPDSPETKFWSVMFCFSLTFLYTAASGLSGVMATDFLQFILAFIVATLIAVLGVNSLGGMDNIMVRLAEIYGTGKEHAMVSMLPFNMDNLLYPLSWFLIYIGLQWWATGNTDGGGYYAQRMISAKNEKHAILGYLWSCIARFCLLPWPWIIVGLVAAVKYPYLPDAVTGKMPDAELGYIKVMVDVMPIGLLGLAVAGFFAAYMSTVDTHMNWGASYMINDVYRRFIKKQATEKHYVIVSILATLLIAIIGAITTFMMQSIIGGWELMAQILAGAGLVYILRWYWWRINAWSELSSFVAALLTTAALKIFASQWFADHFMTPEQIQTMSPWLASTLQFLHTLQFPINLLVLCPVCIFIWLVVTYLTKPVEEEALIRFYKRVQPGGPGWRKIRRKITDLDTTVLEGDVKQNFINYLIAIASIYCTLFGVGQIILGSALLGIGLICVTIIGGFILYQRLSDNKYM